MVEKKCEVCNGKGYKQDNGVVHTCWNCMGQGYFVYEEKKEEVIPKKVMVLKEVKQRKKKHL